MSIKDGGRYEITVDGPCVTIKEPCGFSGEYHRSEYADNVLYGAIRQQARDIAELEVFAEIGRQWNTDSSLAKWFPLTADRLGKDAQEIAKLRADLAAAVAENAALLAANRDCILHFDAIKADYDVMKLRAEQAEARLAAIGSAPVVATVVDIGDECGPNPNVTFYSCQLPPIGTDLIARPARD